MRISTPVNKKTLKHHLDYHGWKYIVLIGLSFALWSVVYTVTRPVAPNELRIDVYVQSETASQELMEAFAVEIWQEAVPEMQEVNIASMLSTDEYNASMQLMTHIMAGDADIYLLTDEYFKRLSREGMLMKLDDLVAEGRLQTADIDLTRGYQDCVLETDENDVPVRTERHLYGIPLYNRYGFMTQMQIDNRQLYACIVVNNGNEENVVKFLDAMLEKSRGEKPDWLLAN